MSEPPGTSLVLDQPIEFEPLTSTVLVQQIQSQLNPNLIEEIEETDDRVAVLENNTSSKSDRTQTEEEKLEITQEKQSNSVSCSGGEEKDEKNHEQKADESKIDEITDTTNILKFSSAPFVEPCETSSSSISQYKNLNNNNNDDEYKNKNIKVAEKEGNDDKSKDILEYLVTFSDSAEQKELKQKESEVSEKPPIPLPTYLWEDLKKAKEQGKRDFFVTHLTS